MLCQLKNVNASLGASVLVLISLSLYLLLDTMKPLKPPTDDRWQHFIWFCLCKICAICKDKGAMDKHHWAQHGEFCQVCQGGLMPHLYENFARAVCRPVWAAWAVSSHPGSVEPEILAAGIVLVLIWLLAGESQGKFKVGCVSVGEWWGGVVWCGGCQHCQLGHMCCWNCATSVFSPQTKLSSLPT